MTEHPDRIPVADCIAGHVYTLWSRNLKLGVFRINHRFGPGFIGIRTKFGDRFLFEEYHWDSGPPYGTANPLVDLGPIPAGIWLQESLGSVDRITGRPVAFDRDLAEEGEGWGSGPHKGWYFTDTEDREYNESIRSYSVPNTPLFEYLENLENQQEQDHE